MKLNYTNKANEIEEKKTTQKKKKQPEPDEWEINA